MKCWLKPAVQGACGHWRQTARNASEWMRGGGIEARINTTTAATPGDLGLEGYLAIDLSLICQAIDDDARALKLLPSYATGLAD